MDYPTLHRANAHFVTSNLLVGGDLHEDDRTAVAQAIELVEAGVTHVLDVRGECDDAVLWSVLPEITYRWEGIDDAGQRVPAVWFDGIVEWALEAIASGGVVLTHCHMGINRGPSAGFAVMLALGWNPVEAMGAIRSARPIAATAYAEDALAWRLSRTRTPRPARAEQRRLLAAWRRANPLDEVRMIRAINERSAS